MEISIYEHRKERWVRRDNILTVWKFENDYQEDLKITSMIYIDDALYVVTSGSRRADNYKFILRRSSNVYKLYNILKRLRIKQLRINILPSTLFTHINYQGVEHACISTFSDNIYETQVNTFTCLTELQEPKKKRNQKENKIKFSN